MTKPLLDNNPLNFETHRYIIDKDKIKAYEDIVEILNCAIFPIVLPTNSKEHMGQFKGIHHLLKEI